MKKITALLLALVVLSCVLTGCGVAGAGDDRESRSGEWRYNSVNTIGGSELEEHDAEALKAIFTPDSRYSVIAYLGEKSEEDTVYACLCIKKGLSEEEKDSLCVAYVHQSPNGPAQLDETTGVVKFDIEKYREDTGGTDTGFRVEYAFAHQNIAAKDVYDSAEPGLGINCTPVALIGTQTADGTGYAFLCMNQELSTMAHAKPAKSLSIVIIKVDSDGNSSVLGNVPLDPGNIR